MPIRGVRQPAASGCPWYSPSRFRGKLGATDPTLLGLAEHLRRSTRRTLSPPSQPPAPRGLRSSRTRSLEHLILCGIETPICVYQTAADALKAGLLVSDSHGLRRGEARGRRAGLPRCPCEGGRPCPALGNRLLQHIGGNGAPVLQGLHPTREKIWLTLPLAPSTVRDLKALEGASGRSFASVLVLRKLSTKTASNGNPYLSVELGDRTGSFTCTVFSDGPAFEAVKGAQEGSVLKVEGKVETYQGRLSPKLMRASVIPEDELSSSEVIANLVETAPEDGELLWKDFTQFVDTLSNPELRATVRNVIEEIGESFRTAPAATFMHHAYRHGLLEHTVHMARVCKALLPLYAGGGPRSRDGGHSPSRRGKDHRVRGRARRQSAAAGASCRATWSLGTSWFERRR